MEWGKGWGETKDRHCVWWGLNTGDQTVFQYLRREGGVVECY